MFVQYSPGNHGVKKCHFKVWSRLGFFQALAHNTFFPETRFNFLRKVKKNS